MGVRCDTGAPSLAGAPARLESVCCPANVSPGLMRPSACKGARAGPSEAATMLPRLPPPAAVPPRCRQPLRPYQLTMTRKLIAVLLLAMVVVARWAGGCCSGGVG